MEKVLVTGAAGFIGAHLVNRLASLNNKVVAIDVRQRPPQLKSERIDYRKVDIRSNEQIKELLVGVKIVYHLASVHLEVHANEEKFADVNVRAVKDFVVACKEGGVQRFVHTSSVGIYGNIKDPPAKEDSPVHPEIPYDRSKLAGESEALRTAGEIGLDLIVLRPAWVYGPGCPRTAKLLRTLDKERFFYIGKGSNLRHPIYIDDMVDAFLLAASAPKELGGKSYIIAGPRAMTLREMVETFAKTVDVSAPGVSVPKLLGYIFGFLAELIFRVVGREPPFSRRSLAFFEHNNAFDTTAAQKELGFMPTVDLEEGLIRTFTEMAK